MPLRTIRRTLVRVRDGLDGRLHPGRRARSLSALSGLRPKSILVLCLGNVCRSPYAARVIAERAPGLTVRSAGFIGPGRAPPEIALEVATGRGVDHGDHRSRVLTAELLDQAEAVLVFDRGNVARLRAFGGADMTRVFWLGDFDPTWAGKRAIIDPWGKPKEDFDRTFARIERCVDEVVGALRA